MTGDGRGSPCWWCHVATKGRWRLGWKRIWSPIGSLVPFNAIAKPPPHQKLEWGGAFLSPIVNDEEDTMYHLHCHQCHIWGLGGGEEGRIDCVAVDPSNNKERNLIHLFLFLPILVVPKNTPCSLVPTIKLPSRRPCLYINIQSISAVG